MPKYQSLEVISETDRGQIILGVDFPATARREADFHDLAARMGTDYKFLRAKSPAARSGTHGYREYLDPWIEEIRQENRPVLAVLGYRVGSVYAASISEEIARWQDEPLLILFDPQPSSAELLSSELRREIDDTMPLFSRDEIERATEITAMVAEDRTADLTSAAAEMIKRYFDVVTVAFERAGLGDIRNGKLNEPFESYISWISAAGAINPADAWKRSTAVVSSDYTESKDHDLVSAIGRRIRFDVARTDLLRSDCTARAVLDLLSAR